LPGSGVTIGEDSPVSNARVERTVAVVFLVDPAGRVLMQHRSRDAKVSPNQWGMPGGRVEPGEQPVEAARRELYEETGLTVDRLEPFWSGTRPSVTTAGAVVEMHAFCAATTARQEDVVLGEGQAMVFLPAAEALARDLGATAAVLLPMFLGSRQYAKLASTSA
jgi:8-oxo-dGTP diphosphatase